MVWRSASPAPAGSTVWRILGPHSETVSEQERTAVLAAQFHVILAGQNNLRSSFGLTSKCSWWGVFEAQAISAGVGGWDGGDGGIGSCESEHKKP